MIKERTGPLVVYIRILEACNSNCIMCRYAKSKDTFRFPVDKLIKLVDELKELGTEYIRFTGGEPLLYNDLFKIVGHISDVGIKPSFISNGMLINNKVKNIVDSRVDQIYVSIDSVEPEVHDHMRGIDGIFNKVVLGIKNLNQYSELKGVNVKIGVNTIVSLNNYDKLDEFLPFLKEIKAKSWTLTPIKDYKGLFLNEDQILEYNKRAEEIFKSAEALGIKINSPNPFIFGNNEKDIKLSSKGIYPTFKGKCYVPNYVAYIDLKNRYLTACNLLPHRSGMPLTTDFSYEKSFNDIWNCEDFKACRDNFINKATYNCSGCGPANIKFNEFIDSFDKSQIVNSVEWY